MSPAATAEGDALFAIVGTPVTAAEIALEIQARLAPLVLEQAGLPPGGGMRISLHYGPIYADHDPIRGVATYYGTEVTLAARIEPRVPIRAIYDHPVLRRHVPHPGGPRRRMQPRRLHRSGERLRSPPDLPPPPAEIAGISRCGELDHRLISAAARRAYGGQPVEVPARPARATFAL